MLFHTCDRVVGTFWCWGSVWRKVSKKAEIYFLSSAESFVIIVIKCPHVQYITPVLQCLRHTLHCHFGSALTISEISMFPASMIATFDSSLNALNDCCCSRSFWTASCCGWLAILRIKNVKILKTFHRFVRNAGIVEINVPIVRRKVELFRIITILRWQSSCTLCNLSSPSNFTDLSWFRTCCSSSVGGFPGLSEVWLFSFRFPWVVVILDMLSSLDTGLPGLSEELGSFCNVPAISWVTGFPERSSMGFKGLGWLGGTRWKCFSKWLLNEFTNWSMFNRKTLIFFFTPIEIVFQRDFRWWTRKQILPFIQFFSISQSFSSYNAICWKCSLRNNCVRSSLMKLQSFFDDSKINIDPKYHFC